MTDQYQKASQYQPQAYLGNVPRADFRTEKFDTLIDQKGYTVLWEEAMFCSCYSASTGQPDYNCPDCYGRGYYYFNPVMTKAIVTSINGHEEQEQFGLLDVGSAYLTPKSSDMVGFRDRFTFVDFRTKFSQLVTRGNAGTPDALRYPADEIIALRTIGKNYKQGIDFELTSDVKSINWLIDPGITSQSYSILYTTPPVYICINPIHELRGTYTMYKTKGQEQFVPLPKQFQIKREDFLEGNTNGIPGKY